MKILLFTNIGESNSLPFIKELISKGENIVGVINSTYRPKINFYRAINNYGILFITKKILIRLISTLKPNILKRFLIKSNIPVITVNDINNQKSIEIIKSLEPDIIIICTFSQIVSKQVINIPKTAIINIHASLLPKYRGPSPLFWTLYHGEKKAGITIHYAAKGIDNGAIIMQREINVSPNDTLKTLDNKISSLVKNMVPAIIESFHNGTITSIPQPENEKKYYKRPTKHDWKIFYKIMKERKKISNENV